MDSNDLEHGPMKNATEGRVSKGGVNPPNESTERPPAPGAGGSSTGECPRCSRLREALASASEALLASPTCGCDACAENRRLAAAAAAEAALLF